TRRCTTPSRPSDTGRRSSISTTGRSRPDPVRRRLHSLRRARDQRREALRARLVALRARDPVRRRPPVPRRLRGEPLPCPRVLAEPRRRRAIERAPPVLVGIDPGLRRRARPERRDPRRPHLPRLRERRNLAHVDRTPVARSLSPGEPDCVALRPETFSHRVDPPEAERLVHRLRPGETRPLRVPLVEPDPDL